MSDIYKEAAEEVAVTYWGKEGETSYNQIVDRVVDSLLNPEETSLGNSKEAYRSLLSNKTFMPNSPVFMNAGTNRKSLAACFVLPIEDSMESIFGTLRDSATIFKEGGGCGFSFSSLRSEGAPVKSTKGVSSGPVSFLRVYDTMVDVIKAGGTRRGAALANLSVDHPDIEKFITCKTDEGEINNFNISVVLTDDFMHRVESGSQKDIALLKKIAHQMWLNGEPGIQFMDTVNTLHTAHSRRYPQYNTGITSSNPCLVGASKFCTDKNELVTIKELSQMSADELYKVKVFTFKGGYSSINKVWSTGVKKVVKIVLGNGKNITCTLDHLLGAVPKRGQIQFTQADKTLGMQLFCADFFEKGRQAEEIYPGEDCTVVAIEDAGEEEVFDFEVDDFGHCAYVDGILAHNCSEAFLRSYESCILGSINLYDFVSPFWKAGFDFSDPKKNINWTQLSHIISLAVRFLNRMLDVTKAPLPLIDSTTRESRKIGLGVMGFADMLSALGLKYGDPRAIEFINFLFAFIGTNASAESTKQGYNNAIVTTIAPTGTIGTVADVSQGIEPHFRLVFNRESVKLGTIPMFCRSLRDFLRETNVPKNDQDTLYQSLKSNGGKFKSTDTLRGTNGSYNLADIWCTTDTVTPIEHINTLANIQKHIDNGVSKTINMPNSATEDEVYEVIFAAWRSACKGFTVYRAGSRTSEVLSEVKDKSPEITATTEVQTEKKKIRSQTTAGETTKVKIGCGNLYVTTNEDGGYPCEVFTSVGRSGGCPSQSEATARLISLSLRSGVPVEEIIDQLKGIRCLSTLAGGKKGGKMPDGRLVLSCPDAIGKCLESFCKKHKECVMTKPVEEADIKLPQPVSEACPKCGSILQPNGGCRICTGCGWSKCG